jgi:hypothetical protein
MAQSELRQSLPAVVNDYTPSKKEYKKEVDLKELEAAGNPSLLKFGGQYFEVPQKPPQINYYPYNQQVQKLHPFYDYEASLKTKSTLENKYA